MLPRKAIKSALADVDDCDSRVLALEITPSADLTPANLLSLDGDFREGVSELGQRDAALVDGFEAYGANGDFSQHVIRARMPNCIG